MTHPRSAEFPGFTSAQIEAGLTTPVCEGVPRYPHADEFADIEAAWGEPEFVAQNPASEPFAFDSLAVAATEYVAAQARVERFWLSLLGAIGVFITAFGLCAWAAFAHDATDWSDPKNQRMEFYQTVPREVARIPACVDTFPKLPALAARLGVAKASSKSDGAVLLHTCNEGSYDFMALINAALDRLDAAEKAR